MRAPTDGAGLARAPRTGVFGGAAAFFEGLGFVVGTPRVWPLAAVPALVALVLFAGAAAAGVWGALALVHRAISDTSSALGAAGAVLLEILLAAVAVLVALLVAMTLAQPLSGFALDGVARAQERALRAPEPPPRPPLGAMLRALGVTLTALALGLPLLAVLWLVTVVFPPASVVTVPLKVVVSALMIAWDLLDYPLGARGLGARARLAFVRAHFGAVLGFGLAAAFVLLVPGVGLLVLPFGVAGAARLVYLLAPPAGAAAQRKPIA